MSGKRPHPEAHRVEVEWDDSTIPHVGWMPHADVVAPGYRRKHVRCLSVGLLLADDKHGIALASSAHGNEVAGVTIIPRGQVESELIAAGILCPFCRRASMSWEEYGLHVLAHRKGDGT